MKRKILILILVFIFNIILIKGIGYANRAMFANNFLIRILDSPQIDNNDDNGISDDNENINTEYEGESIESIGRKIEKYLKETKLEGYGNYIAKNSINKSVNPYLVGGIILENTNCDVDCSIILKSCNNVGDLKGKPGCFGGSYKKYSTMEMAIDDLIKYILDKFYANNLNNPNDIYSKYGKDTSWAFKVTRRMEVLKKTK